jgi:dihydrofolate reductase
VKVFVFVNLTLDGVMQGPASPEEDTRGGFKRGGWGAPYAAMPSAGEAMANVGGLLVGRWTYEQFYAVWPERTDSPYSAWMDNITKYVASRTLKEPLPWKNSVLLRGDATEAVAKLRKEPGKDLVIMGSGELVQSLMRRNLVDEYVLLIHPLVLGTGRRLFTDGGAAASLRLLSSKTTDKGVIVATYRPADPASG